jgi:hypothetical protein
VSPRCRSCGQEIEFAKTEGGRWMPIDREPVPSGNLVVDRSTYPPIARVIGPGEGSRQLAFDSEDGEVLAYRSHFSSCPQAKEWRRR